MDVAESDKIDIGSVGNCKNKITKRSPLPKSSNRATHYLMPNTMQTFTQLKQTFTKVPIFQHFDLKYHIWI